MWRDGAVVALTTMDTSEHGTERIMRIMRRSKLAAISLSRQGVTRRLTAEQGIGRHVSLTVGSVL